MRFNSLLVQTQNRNTHGLEYIRNLIIEPLLVLLLHLLLHLRKLRIMVSILSCHLRRRDILLPPGLVHAAVDQDDVELRMVLQDLDVGERVAVDDDAVRVVARFDLAELVLAHEQLGHAGRRGDDALVRGEAEQLLEVGEVAGVGAVGGPGEAVVPRILMLV